MQYYAITGDPVAKPRMTKRDVWAKRPIVEKYRAWADSARLQITGDAALKLDADKYRGIYCIFHMPINESWADTRKAICAGKLHYGRPDVDNMLKAVADALLVQDWGLSFMAGIKVFRSPNENTRIELFLLEEKDIDNFRGKMHNMFVIPNVQV